MLKTIYHQEKGSHHLITRVMVVPTVIAGLGISLVACSSSDDSDNTSSSEQATTTASVTENTTSAGSASSASSATSASQAESASAAGATEVTGPDGVTMSVSKAEGLADGDTVKVKVTNADPDMGYYLALCAAEKSGQVPDCLGKHGDPEAQKWISNKNQDGAIPEQGNFDSEIVVHPTGETKDGKEIDCATSKCVVKLFGDHSNGFVDVVDVPVTFQ